MQKLVGSGEVVDGGGVEAADVPVGEDVGADFLVEGDAAGVPVEDGPLEAAAVAVAGGLGEALQQRGADAAAAVFGEDEKVFERGEGGDEGEDGGDGGFGGGGDGEGWEGHEEDDTEAGMGSEEGRVNH